MTDVGVKRVIIQSAEVLQILCVADTVLWEGGACFSG